MIPVTRKDKGSMYKTSNNIWILGSLFINSGASGVGIGKHPEYAKYTLEDQDLTLDGKTYPSFRRLYLELGDPSEVEFVKRYLGSWEHWERLLECNWFKPYIDSWRKELEVSIKAKVLLGIIEEASDSKRKNSYNAKRYLLDTWSIGLTKDRLVDLVGKKLVGRPRKTKDTSSSTSILKDIVKEYTQANSKEIN
jgi:hypothetical protein